MKQTDKVKGHTFILQINKEAEDLLYPRFGKMSWGMSVVYLRLKKRNPTDKNTNVLENGEVEKDLEFLTEATTKIKLDGACPLDGPDITSKETKKAIDDEVDSNQHAS